MNERAQLVKQAIAEELAKEGMSLADLEQALVKQGNEKTAAGPSFLLDPSHVGGFFSALGNIGASSALGVGGLMGVGAYGAYLQNEDSNHKILKKLKERQQYIDAANNLKADMENPIKL